MNIKPVLIKINAIARVYGFDCRTAWNSIRGTYAYLREERRFRKLMRGRTDWLFHKFPVLADRYSQSGEARGHYFHQDMLVARLIYKRNPRRQIDVGSRIDGFIAHLATFREVNVVDIRPLEDRIYNVRFIQMDLMKDVSEANHAICDSLSCLHTLEHFGLGRYGDELDPDGYKKGFANLLRMLEPGGILYLSVPIGKQRIEFNAHRIFSLRYLLDMFNEFRMKVDGFHYIDDDGKLHEDVNIDSRVIDQVDSMWYSCGVFELLKPQQST